MELGESPGPAYYLQASLNTGAILPIQPQAGPDEGGGSQFDIRVAPHWFPLQAQPRHWMEPEGRWGNGDSSLSSPIAPHSALAGGKLSKCGRGRHEDLKESGLRTQLSISELLLLGKGWGQAHQSQLEVFCQAKCAPTVGGRRLIWVDFWHELVQRIGCFF